MKVKELIEELLTLPQDAYVWHLVGGIACSEINHIWLAVNGYVVTADDDERCIHTEDRPKSAPTAEADRYWKTPYSGRGNPDFLLSDDGG